MKKHTLFLILLICQMGFAQLIKETARYKGKDLFEVNVGFDLPDVYPFRFKNVSGKSIYIVPSGSDIGFTKAEATIVFGERLNPLSDGEYYDLQEIKSGEGYTFKVKSGVDVKLAIVTVILKKIDFSTGHPRVRKDHYYKYSRNFQFEPIRY